MKIGKRVKHHVNMGNYESVEFESWAELEVDNFSDQVIEDLDNILDTALDPELNEAAKNSSERTTYVTYWKDGEE